MGPTSKRDDARDGAQNTAHVVVIMLIVAFGVLALPWMVLRKLDAREQTRGVAASGVPDEDLAQGGKIYYRSCANCHQARGEGKPGRYPPLVGSSWLLEDKAGVVLDDAFHLLGSGGAAHLSAFPPQLSYWRSDGLAVPDVSYDPTIRGAAFGALRDELSYFCECVRSGRKPEVIRPAEARNAVAVALALTTSAIAGHDVAIRDWM